MRVAWILISLFWYTLGGVNFYMGNPALDYLVLGLLSYILSKLEERK